MTRRTLRIHWRSRFVRRVAANVIVGLGLEFIFLLLQGSHLADFLEDLSLDWMIQMHSGTPPARSPAIPFTVVDIDEETYRKWGEPLLIPRDKLLRLVQFAIAGRAALVVVDVDLSRPAGVGGAQESVDVALVDYFERRSPLPEGVLDTRKGSGPTPIILVRTFRVPLSAAASSEPKDSFLDQAVSIAPDLYWAAPLFQLDRDFVVRRWRLWEATCGNKHGDVVPSIQLLVATLLLKPQNRTGGLEGVLAPFRHFACGTRSARPDHDSTAANQLRLGRVVLNVDESHLERRILYSIPWKLGPTDARPRIDIDGRPMPLLFQIPAHQIIDAPEGVAKDKMLGRVVVIGGSFLDGRDIYATPLGPMPGTFIIINAIHSLVQYGELQRPPRWVTGVVTALVIVVVSVVFAMFTSFAGTVIAGVIIILLLLPISFWLFQAGVWFEFAIPLTGVLLHHLYADVEEARRRGLRAAPDRQG